MGIIKLGPQNFDQSTIITHPSRSFSSSSYGPKYASSAKIDNQGGITGSIFIFDERSSAIKDAEILVKDESQNLFFTGEKSQKLNLQELVRQIDSQNVGVEADGEDKVVQSAKIELFDFIRTLPESARLQSTASIKRYTQPAPNGGLEAKNLAFNTIQKTMFPYYQSTYPRVGMNYNNYHSLNFFTASNVPTGSCLIYPAVTMSVDGGSYNDLPILAFNQPYRPKDAFTFSFYINPRYNDTFDSTSGKAGHFRAGTIMHMSSSYAVSLVTGSTVGQDGKPNSFRIMLQLSHSADVAPSKVDLKPIEYFDNRTGNSANHLNAYPQDLIFLSSDSGSLKHNHWHHVAIVWPGWHQDNASGSFIIDNKIDSQFCLGEKLQAASGTSNWPITQWFPEYTTHPGYNKNWGRPRLRNRGVIRDPDALFIGNFYEGANQRENGSAISGFFNNTVATNEGIHALTSSADDPRNVRFTHPLNAEIHDIRIYQVALTRGQINSASHGGPRLLVTQSSYAQWKNSSDTPKKIFSHQNAKAFLGGDPVNPELMLYIPPFFVKESRPRKIFKGPFDLHNKATTTINPINASLSFNANIHEINLQNFTREFVRAEYPRLYNMTSSESTQNWDLKTDGQGLVVNDGTEPVKYTARGSTSEERKGINKCNTTILPCDNGLFFPNFAILLTGSTGGRQFTKTSNYNERARVGMNLKPPQSDRDPVYQLNLDVPIMSGSELDRFVNSNTMISRAKDPRTIDYLVTGEDTHTPIPPKPTVQGILDLSLIDLSDIIFVHKDRISVFYNQINFENMSDNSSIVNTVVSSLVTPFYPVGSIDVAESNGIGPYMFLTTMDPSSKATVLFDVPHIFYGDAIQEKTFKMKGGIGTTKLSSTTKFQDTNKITLKDDGESVLYRADAKTPHATWNKVGNILYGEGLALLTSPHLKDFGELDHSLEFKGSRNIHVLEIMIPCPAGMINSSSNPSFKDLAPSDESFDQNSKFVYLSGLSLHDDNFNVLSRTSLAQPVIKRSSDKLMFRLKIDF